MRVIARIPENGAIPSAHRLIQILATEDLPIGTGTNTRRVYTVELEDERYWLNDAEKLKDRAT